MITKKYILLFLGSILASALSAQPPLLNDTFSGSSGTLGASGTPGVNGWFLEGAAGSTATYTQGTGGSPGSLVVTNGGTGDGVLKYFTTPQTLNVGDAITATINFSVVNGGAGNALRLAILNSQGSHMTTNTTNSNAIFFNYQGFASNFSPSNFGPENIYQRTGSNNALLSTNGGIWTTIAATPLPTGGTLSSGTPYAMVVTITLTGASTISIASQINDNTGTPVTGYTNTATSIATNLTTTFDTFVLHALSNTVATFTLTGVNIIYTPQGQAAAPTFSPAAGNYFVPQSISIASATSGTSIRYTTDGVTTPTETVGTLYSGPVSISSPTKIQAIAYGNLLIDSAVATASYTFNPPVPTAVPTFSPGAGNYTSPQLITIVSATGSSATIHYTTDGSTPTSTTSPTCLIYSSPVPIGSTTTIQAIASSPGNPDSTVSTSTYSVKLDLGGHGGGALDGWFLGVLAILGVFRWRRTRR